MIIKQHKHYTYRLILNILAVSLLSLGSAFSVIVDESEFLESLKKKVAPLFSSFLKDNRNNLLEDKVCPALRFLRDSQELSAAEKAKIIGTGIGLGGISQRVATEDERKLYFTLIAEIKNKNVKRETFFSKESNLLAYLADHQKYIAVTYNSVQGAYNFSQDNGAYQKLKQQVESQYEIENKKWGELSGLSKTTIEKLQQKAFKLPNSNQEKLIEYISGLLICREERSSSVDLALEFMQPEKESYNQRVLEIIKLSKPLPQSDRKNFVSKLLNRCSEKTENWNNNTTQFLLNSFYYYSDPKDWQNFVEEVLKLLNLYCGTNKSFFADIFPTPNVKQYEIIKEINFIAEKFSSYSNNSVNKSERQNFFNLVSLFIKKFPYLNISILSSTELQTGFFSSIGKTAKNIFTQEDQQKFIERLYSCYSKLYWSNSKLKGILDSINETVETKNILLFLEFINNNNVRDINHIKQLAVFAPEHWKTELTNLIGAPSPHFSTSFNTSPLDSTLQRPTTLNRTTLNSSVNSRVEPLVENDWSFEKKLTIEQVYQDLDKQPLHINRETLKQAKISKIEVQIPSSVEMLGYIDNIFKNLNLTDENKKDYLACYNLEDVEETKLTGEKNKLTGKENKEKFENQIQPKVLVLLKTVWGVSLDYTKGEYSFCQYTKDDKEDLKKVLSYILKHLEKADSEQKAHIFQQLLPTLVKCESGQAQAIETVALSLQSANQKLINTDNFQVKIERLLTGEKNDLFRSVVLSGGEQHNVHALNLYYKLLKDELGLSTNFENFKDKYSILGRGPLKGDPAKVLQAFYNTFTPEKMIGSVYDQFKIQEKNPKEGFKPNDLLSDLIDQKKLSYMNDGTLKGWEKYFTKDPYHYSSLFQVTKEGIKQYLIDTGWLLKK